MLAHASFLKDQIILIHLNGGCDLALLPLSTGDFWAGMYMRLQIATRGDVYYRARRFCQAPTATCRDVGCSAESKLSRRQRLFQTSMPHAASCLQARTNSLLSWAMAFLATACRLPLHSWRAVVCLLSWTSMRHCWLPPPWEHWSCIFAAVLHVWGTLSECGPPGPPLVK